MDFQYLA